MTPFLQFRIWFRRASTGQRMTTIGAAVAAIALVCWAAVPSGNPGSGGGALQAVGTGSGFSSSSTTVGTAPSTGGSAPGSSTTPGGGSGTPGGSGGSQPGTTPTAVGPDNSSQTPGGVNPTSSSSTVPGNQITPASCTKRGTLQIGVLLPNEGGGQLNTVFGIPSASQEQADYNAVFNSINKAGGVDCYNLSGVYEGVDGTDPSTAQTACLTFAQDKVFAVVGGLLPAAPDDCLMQHHLPTFEQIPIPGVEQKQYYPYYFSIDPTFEVLYKNFADAVKQMGYFSPAKHFAKMGVFYRDCIPSVNQAMLADLAAVGVSGPKVVTYDLGCPTPQPYASESTVQQAVLKFEQEGVTTVTVDNDYEDVQELTNTSETDGFHPTWLIPDTGVSAVSSSPEFEPNKAEFNGAIAITPEQYGAENSGLPLTAGTQACNAIMKAAGLPTVYQSPDEFAGSTCSLPWMLEAAIAKVGANQTQLVKGLQEAGSTQTSFPDGPDNFSAPGTTTGGQDWRPIQFQGSCGCWKIVSANWSPSFS